MSLTETSTSGLEQNLHPVSSKLKLLTNVFFQDAVAIGMAELTQSFGLDLANALTGHVEDLANLFQSLHAAIIQAVAQAQHIPLTGTEGTQHAFQIFPQQALRNLILWGFPIRFNEISQARIFFFTDRGFKGNEMGS